MSQDYIQLVNQLIHVKGTITKEFFIILPVTDNVENEIDKMTEYLSHCGNLVERCNKKQIIEVLKNFTNKRIMNLVG